MDPNNQTTGSNIPPSVTAADSTSLRAAWAERLAEVLATTVSPRERAAKVAQLKAQYQQDVYGISVKVDG